MYRGPSPSKVFIKQEPKCKELAHDAALLLKAEPEHSDTWPPLEPCSRGVWGQRFKQELRCEERRGGPAEGARMQDLYFIYEGHKMKGEELAIGLEVWHQPALSAPVLRREATELLESTLCPNNNYSSEPPSHVNCKKTENIIHKQLSCNICDKTFSSKSCLNRHQRIHTGENTCKCNMCGKKFTGNCDLKVHLRIHSGEKPYKCGICMKEFAEKTKLTIHLRVHSGEKPYICFICKKKFTQSSNLTTHLRVHREKERRFICNICDKTFLLKHVLTEHLRCVHGEEKPFACKTCNKKFSDRSNLTKHNRVHNREKPYVCDTCDKKFSFRSNLARHMRIGYCSN